MAIKWLTAIAILAVLLAPAQSQEQPACEYNSFLDALDSGLFSDYSFFTTAINLSGYKDKLPSPSGPISLTLLVPTNKAFLKLLWNNGLFLPILSKVGDALPATVMYNALIGGLSPDQIKNKTIDNQGSAPSAYGLLGGNGASINYYSQADGDKTVYKFLASMNSGNAGATTVIQVCNSWIYVTDTVLVPSDDGKLGGVEKVTIPEDLFNSGGGDNTETTSPPPVEQPIITVPDLAEAPAPAEAPIVCMMPNYTKPITTNPTAPAPKPAPIVTAPIITASPAPAPVPAPFATPSSCNTTLADVAKANGLSILATALGQPAIASQMPDPANPTTFFAPVDTAFINLLTTLNISITDALALGDKLAGVILYHIHPNEALNNAAISQRDFLTTELGFRLNDASKYNIGVESSTTGLRLTGLRTGNVATVQKEFDFCGSTVHVIDQVLLPAETVDQFPAPGPVTTTEAATTTQPASQEEVPAEPTTTTATTMNAIKADENADGVEDILNNIGDIVGNIVPGYLGENVTDIVNDLGDNINGIVDDVNSGDINGIVEDVTGMIDQFLPGILDSGIANGIGQFINCTIELTAAGTTLKSTTDAAGRFSFPGVPDCAIGDGMITLPAGLDQLATCVDSSTGLQPPYTFAAMLSDFLGALNTNTPNNSTFDLPINLSPLTDLISSIGKNGQVDISNLTSTTADVFGFNDAASAAFGDIAKDLQDGSPDSVSSILGNVQTLISNTVGGNVLSQLLPGIGIDQAVSSITKAIGGDLSGALTNLADPDTLMSIFKTGFNLLSSSSGDGSSSIFGRKMLQTDQQNEDLDTILAAVAEPTATLNKLAQDAALDGELTPEEVADLAARCARVAQLRLAPAAGDLANGKLGLSDFQTSYSTDQVTKAVNMEDLSSNLNPIVVADAPAPASAADISRASFLATLLFGALSMVLFGMI